MKKGEPNQKVSPIEDQLNLFKTLLEASNRAIFLLDGSNVIYYNQVALELFGFENGLKEPFAIQPYILHFDSRQDGKKRGEEFLKKLKCVEHGEVQNFYWKHLKRDENSFDIYVSLKPVDIADKQYIYAEITDISMEMQRRKIVRTINKLIRHELRGKIQILNGYLGILASKTKGETQSLLNKIQDNATSINEFLEKIRQYQRVEVAEEIDYVGLKTCVKNAIAENYTHPKLENEMAIVTNQVDTDLRVNSLLEIVFTNLIHNALDHSKGKTIEIASQKNSAESEVVIIVKDDGVGIPKHVMNNIFQPKIKSEQSSGTGMGLFLVKKIINSMDGTIKIQNNNGANIQIKLYLDTPHVLV